MAEALASDDEAVDGAAEPPHDEEKATKATARRWGKARSWLRVLHRDIGYFIVGMTVIYAVSGLAVNHIADWDSNFITYEHTHQLGPLPKDDKAAAAKILAALKVTAKPEDVFRSDADELEIQLDNRTLTATLSSGAVLDRGRTPRFFVRVANWLHLNRGKKAWTYFADGYAVLLLFIAMSGVLMLPGRKGLIGRGGVLVVLGAALPAAYVVLSGGP